MNGTTLTTWYEANQRYLMEAVAQVRTELEQCAGRAEHTSNSDEKSAPVQPALDELASSMSAPPALETLCASFGLSTFERKIVLMCAGVELDSRFAAACGSAHRDPRRSQPTFSLALAACEDAHWSALSPSAPLRRWHFVELMSGDMLTTRPLRLDERILHYLAGVSCLDERLQSLTDAPLLPGSLPSSQQRVAEQIAEAWSRANGHRPIPLVQLCGDDLSSKRGVATAACALLGLELRMMPAGGVPRSSSDLEFFLRLWEREAILRPSGLLLECDDLDLSDAPGEAAIQRFTEIARSPLLVSSRVRRRFLRQPQLALDVPGPTPNEQREIWQEALGTAMPSFDGTMDRLLSQFSLHATTIRSVTSQALGDLPQDSETANQQADSNADLAERLWDACRVQARPQLEGLAQRIEPSATWDDLVLPEKQKELLSHIAIHVRQRAKVYQTWGFASKGLRGLGISALFAGLSGTGKTMAGEVLANELKLDLYRIDLSQVVSKYIGETEKNLRRVFDAAEEGAAILLFDEADALFGKRSDVKDSHDRYANIEVSYLLQRMETYRGLAILTTNRKAALDHAFLRRIRFVVEFPFPEAAQRAEIWRRIFPLTTPTEGLQVDRLARLNAAGGHIRNIAINAAFLAADSGEPVRMAHLLCASRSEFAKLEKPLAASEIVGWV
jgi:hypothetical protein